MYDWNWREFLFDIFPDSRYVSGAQYIRKWAKKQLFVWILNTSKFGANRKKLFQTVSWLSMCGDVTMEKYFNLSKTLFSKPNEYQKRVLFWKLNESFRLFKVWEWLEQDRNRIKIIKRRVFLRLNTYARQNFRNEPLHRVDCHKILCIFYCFLQ